MQTTKSYPWASWCSTSILTGITSGVNLMGFALFSLVYYSIIFCPIPQLSWAGLMWPSLWFSFFGAIWLHGRWGRLSCCVSGLLGIKAVVVNGAARCFKWSSWFDSYITASGRGILCPPMLGPGVSRQNPKALAEVLFRKLVVKIHKFYVWTVAHTTSPGIDLIRWGFPQRFT